MNLFQEKKRYRGDARMLASAIKDGRVTLAEARPMVERAMELASESATLREHRFFVSLVAAVQAFMRRAADERLRELDRTK